ncbi:MAG: DsrE/DsrF/DrsH-like family protein [Bryobacteraceae bacterium]
MPNRTADTLDAAADPARDIRSIVAEEVARELARRDRALPCKKLAILVFSGEMDRVFSALAMANAAAAMGMDATVFFSFWGAAVLRKAASPAGKPLIERLLGRMMPAGPDVLPVSRMNFGGLGAVFFRWWMGKKQMQSLTEMLDDARDLGVRLMICETSLAVMGFRRDEIIAGVESCGVTGFLRHASESGPVLFV